MKTSKKIIICLCLIFCLMLSACRKKQIEISFDSNGGSIINAVEIKKGSTVNKPSDPTKEGYIFLGWYLNENLFDFNTSLKENTTLIAKWNIKEYVITFDTDSLDQIGNQKIKYNEAKSQGRRHCHANEPRRRKRTSPPAP